MACHRCGRPFRRQRHEGLVHLLDRARGECVGQAPVRRRVPGEEHDPRGVTVESLVHAEPDLAARPRQVGLDGAHQAGPSGIGGGHRGQARWFVDRDEDVVLVQDRRRREREAFVLRSARTAQTRHVDARFEREARSQDLARGASRTSSDANHAGHDQSPHGGLRQLPAESRHGASPPRPCPVASRRGVRLFGGGDVLVKGDREWRGGRGMVDG